MAAAREFWRLNSEHIEGFLLDISGVLVTFGQNECVIEGSLNAVQRLLDANVPVRFCTNESQFSSSNLVAKLNHLGFSSITENLVFSPCPALCRVLKERELRPHLLVNPEILCEFDLLRKDDPNCVVLGDAESHFTYDNLNTAFRLIKSLKNPVLFSLGLGKYYNSDSGLKLDVGAFTKALEFACDIKAEVIGKPSELFFLVAVKDMQFEASKVVMIGDDIVSDVGGSQRSGMFGVQVRTGKFRPSDENHPVVKPHCYVDNLAEAVDLYLKYK